VEICGESRELREKGGLFMRTSACVLTLFLICGSVNVMNPITGHSADVVERTVRGTVVATNTAVDPWTIVVNVLLPNKGELIVGARVPGDTRIARGKQAVRLEDAKVGETVTITYLKTNDGLIARSIHLR
jgi:hypothetical protein